MTRKTRVILRPAKKLGMVLLLLVQLFRLTCIGATFYVTYTSLLVDGQVITMFDQVGSSGLSEESEVLSESKEDHNEILNDCISISVPAVEVAVSLLVTYIIMGPLTRQVSIIQWIKWLLRLRLFWMRLIWATTGVAYAVLQIQYHADKYAKERDPKYHFGILDKVSLCLTALEYACLGMVESVVKVINVNTIEKRLQTYDKGIIGHWKKLCMLSYYLATLAFALRSFSMSLHFGILTAIASSSLDLTSIPVQISSWEKRQKGLIIVFQIYLAIMRGKFYGFFMRSLLANLLWEVDNEALHDELQCKISPEPEVKESDSESFSTFASIKVAQKCDEPQVVDSKASFISTRK